MIGEIVQGFHPPNKCKKMISLSNLFASVGEMESKKRALLINTVVTLESRTNGSNLVVVLFAAHVHDKF